MSRLARRAPSPRATLLRDLQSCFEMNYCLLQRLAPGLRQGQAVSFLCDGLSGDREVRLVRREQGPWMMRVDVVESGAGEKPWRPPLLASVRIYHDACVAEVIEMQHRRLLARYPYPNPDMHLPDEKLQTNRLFGEWLQHCLHCGRAPGVPDGRPVTGGTPAAPSS